MKPTQSPTHSRKLLFRRWLWGLVGLAYLASFSAVAQNAALSPPANDTVPAEDLSPTNDVAEPDDLAQASDEIATNNLAQTNSQSQTGGEDARARRLRRQRQNQANAAVGAGGFGQANNAAGTNGGRASLDYSAFRMVADRNIFDPNRYPRRPGVRRQRSAPQEFFTLVGTMTYEKGTFAFFDGTSSEYRKALKLAGTIGDYTVTDIVPNAVKLAAGTNQVELRVGMQLRREEDGPWLPASASAAYAAGSSTTTASQPEAAPSGPESDILKKLMQRREQE